ncbi:glutathione-disulfide reductase [Pandoraea terrae]|uniref:Glutathione-disulfide reductase n=1 Tax=Pandoraea terrae TaxID=1537710 RepID=A0A5E4Y3S6_9BURK|nr:FAD-dependent oxidoreductase [Pandoraea terrae]VVE42975.1 glutathione-disulfide reductase [Pandoraea terrae]
MSALVATGGRPSPHPALPGHEHCITSNEAFHLEALPKSIMIGGGGYIAVEFANIFHGLGVKTTLVYRGTEILNRFDMDLRTSLHEAMSKKGIEIVCCAVAEEVVRRDDGRLDVRLNNGETCKVDQFMLAMGRSPNTEGLGLDAVGIETSATGAILVDRYSRKAVGAHIMGPDAGEMAQLLGIPLKAGVTKDDFDRAMAVHPTAAEELVTMYKPNYRVRKGERID